MSAYSRVFSGKNLQIVPAGSKYKMNVVQAEKWCVCVCVCVCYVCLCVRVGGKCVVRVSVIAKVLCVVQWGG